MIVTLDDAVFAAATEPLLLLSILHHGFEGRHIILTDPVFKQGGKSALNIWLAARDPLVRDAVEETLRRGLNAYGGAPTKAAFRVGTRTSSHWTGAPPDLTLEDAARVLALPLLLVLEDRHADKHFLRCVVPEPRRRMLREALERGWVRAEHGGGLGNMKHFVEGLRDEPAERMRVWILFDSDAPRPAQPSSASEELRKVCAGDSLPHHQLLRRSIENYLPPEALWHWAAKPRGVPGTQRQRRVQEFEALPPEARCHIAMKDTFESDIARLFREEDFTIDPMWLKNDGQRPELDAIAQGLFERM